MSLVLWIIQGVSTVETEVRSTKGAAAVAERCDVCNVFAVSSTLLTQVSSLHPGGGSDTPERNDASHTESKWCESVFLNSINITAEMNAIIRLWIFFPSFDEYANM